MSAKKSKKNAAKIVTPKKKPITKALKPVTDKKPQKTAVAAKNAPATPIQKTELPAMAKIPKAIISPTTPKSKPAAKASKLSLEDDLLLVDLEEKEDFLEEEKRDLAKALNDDDDTLDASFVPTDTSERYILVVDEEGKRRGETVTIISQILPNAIVEVADDPDEAWDIMQDCDFDTYVVNFLMPGYSASAFVKAVANHPDHPLLLGFAADKISDAVDPKKGLKIIPLKRLFDLDAGSSAENAAGGAQES